MSRPTPYDSASELTQLPLGKPTQYSEHYNPSLLMAVPRALNRNELDLSATDLPFIGADIWNAYELSWLNSRGKPMVALAEVVLPATSPNLVESKSFKLYLNSFNQSRFDTLEAVRHALAHDLSACAGESVSVRLILPQDFTQLTLDSLPGECIDELDVAIEQYDYAPALLDGAVDPRAEVVDEALHSHLLKSNCLITNQPDWGSVYIDYRGPVIDRAALLRYLVSFRQHNEFHEQCVERIFMDITHYCRPEKLTVYARYTRRGGLDINPWRSSEANPPANIRLARQ